MALGLRDVAVGTWTSPAGPCGCTVVLPPEGTVGAIAVRGASPGTREAAALGPAGKVGVCHAVVLAGGSAYGLAAADGVMGWLEAQGRGYPVGDAVVPIVGAAIILDEGVRDPAMRPDSAAGWAAAASASTDEPPQGSVGAGAGATVAKVGGLDASWRSGQGVHVVEHGDLVVGALVVNNAVGEVVDARGQVIVGTRAAADAPRFPYADLPRPGAEGPTQNTVIGCIVTNAALTKAEAHRVADLAHGGVVQAVRPAHTSMDGDALFALATGGVQASVDLVAHLAVEAVAGAARRGPLAARSARGLPAKRDVSVGPPGTGETG